MTRFICSLAILAAFAVGTERAQAQVYYQYPRTSYYSYPTSQPYQSNYYYSNYPRSYSYPSGYYNSYPGYNNSNSYYGNRYYSPYGNGNGYNNWNNGYGGSGIQIQTPVGSFPIRW